MTRGRIIIITDNGYCISQEYNGDMYVEHYGKEVIDRLKKVKNIKDYKKENSEFCYEYYNNEEEIKKYNSNETFNKRTNINMIGKTYYDNFFSDYLYLKNITKDTKEIIDYDGKVKKIKPNEIQVYYFGTKLKKKEVDEGIKQYEEYYGKE